MKGKKNTRIVLNLVECFTVNQTKNVSDLSDFCLFLVPFRIQLVKDSGCCCCCCFFLWRRNIIQILFVNYFVQMQKNWKTLNSSEIWSLNDSLHQSYFRFYINRKCLFLIMTCDRVLGFFSFIKEAWKILKLIFKITLHFLLLFFLSSLLKIQTKISWIDNDTQVGQEWSGR